MAERLTTESHERLERSGVLILDIPVIHKGYVDLLERYVSQGNIETLYIVGGDILESLGVPKEIRALEPGTAADLLQRGLNLPFNVQILHLDEAGNLPRQNLFTARDEVSRRMRERFFPDAQLTQESVFLRWDQSNVTSPRPGQFDRETSEDFHVQMVARARELAGNSSDWWRRVGVVIVRDGRVLIEAYNKAFPTENAPYIDGDPRDYISSGELGFLSGTLHGEQAAIARASNQGISLRGADLYLNSYPCHACAAMMAEAGIVRCFFSGGNAYLNVEEVLRAAGIETIFVREE